LTAVTFLILVGNLICEGIVCAARYILLGRQLRSLAW
jgi:hypothetical protein